MTAYQGCGEVWINRIRPSRHIGRRPPAGQSVRKRNRVIRFAPVRGRSGKPEGPFECLNFEIKLNLDDGKHHVDLDVEPVDRPGCYGALMRP